VERIQADPQERPRYFVQAEIRWRRPDKQKRLSRSVVVMTFLEAEQWRIGTPPRAVVKAMLGETSNEELSLDLESSTQESP
jgi:hypothetical protein